jgi:hypothetical protein
VLGRFPCPSIGSRYYTSTSDRCLTAGYNTPWDLASARVLLRVKSGERRALWRRCTPVTRPPPLRLKLCRYEKNTYRAFGDGGGTNVLPETSRCGGCSRLQRTWILWSGLLLGTGRIRLLRTSLLASPVLVARPLEISVAPAATKSRSHLLVRRSLGEG